MNNPIILIVIFNIIIAIIGTLAYSVRIVGIRTGKIAISFALFNALSLISRMAGVFQLPLLTKYIESFSGNQNTPNENIIGVFNIILLAIFFSSIVGTFLIPTFQRLFTRAVNSFSVYKSFNLLILHTFTTTGIRSIRQDVKLPSKNNITKFNFSKVPKRILVFNIISVALLTVGVFAPIYAGYLLPSLRATCLTLSSVVNSLAIILLTLFVDPYLSIITDEVIEKKYDEGDFRSCIVGLLGTRVIGTLFSLLLFVPAAHAIIFVAKQI